MNEDIKSTIYLLDFLLVSMSILSYFVARERFLFFLPLLTIFYIIALLLSFNLLFSDTQIQDSTEDKNGNNKET